MICNAPKILKKYDEIDLESKLKTKRYNFLIQGCPFKNKYDICVCTYRYVYYIFQSFYGYTASNYATENIIKGEFCLHLSCKIYLSRQRY